MIKTRLVNQKKIYILISLIATVIVVFPLESLGGVDRLNYLNYATTSEIIANRSLTKGFLVLLSNEPVFLLINYMLNKIFSPEIILIIISSFSIFGVLSSLGKISNYSLWVPTFFILIPQVSKNHTLHMRQGLALSFYLIGRTTNNKYLSWLKYLAIFVHSSFIFVIGIEIIEKILLKMKLEKWIKIYIVGLILMVGIRMIPIVATVLGDRRISYYNIGLNNIGSGIGLIWWLGVGILFIILTKKDYYTTNTYYGLILYYIGYFTLPFGARIFENYVPIIIAQSLAQKIKIKKLFIGLFIFYSILLRL